jgi:hypothetical protein
MEDNDGWISIDVETANELIRLGVIDTKPAPCPTCGGCMVSTSAGNMICGHNCPNV